jgi:hypothetical protein
MLADILGFYLPVLGIGAYLWHRFRDRTGAMGDMALLAIALYAIVGVAGAAIQLAALNPLAQLHAGGDASVRAAAETTWTALANASQKGLWWSEGPVVLFWGLVVGPQLAKEAWGQPRLVLLNGVQVEAPLDGSLLLITNNDQPGVIGAVGTTLGRQRVNIANFALGRNEKGAVGVVSVDDPDGTALSRQLLEEIRSLPPIKEAWAVRV